MYDSPQKFLPLMPAVHMLVPYLERAASIVYRAAELSGFAHPNTRGALQDLLRSMNSYYSNGIAGQGTSPRNIDAALRQEFSDRPEIARLQRIAVAHMDAEREVEEQAARVSPLNADFVQIAHRALYGRLESHDRTTKDGLAVEPGTLREIDVTVGRHSPPAWQSLPQFMEAFTSHYGRQWTNELRLIAIACAHQRMAWMHPFADGNGRATRLQTHAAMWPVTRGLWSVNRGLARGVQDYHGHLSAADAPRQDDLDGRGNLTQTGLLLWIDYFLRVCEEQVDYMSRMLALNSMKEKIKASVLIETAKGRLRAEAALPIYHLFAAGPATRGEFIQMTGLGERTGRSLLAAALKCGLVASDTSHAPVRFAFPLDSLPILLPALYGAEE